MNKVVLMGRLTADPEVYYTTGENSKANARFTLAVNRKFKNAEGNYDADFIRCVAWDKTAEFIQKYFHKGDMMAIDGNIRTGSFTNKENQKVYTTDVYVDNVEFCGGKNSNGASNTTPAMNRPEANDFINQGVNENEENLPF